MKCRQFYGKQHSVISDVDENTPAPVVHMMGRKITKINKRLPKLYSPVSL
jgi:hypothetical protein